MGDGPHSGHSGKTRGNFRWQLLLQHPSRGYLQKLMSVTYPQIVALPESKK